MGISLKTDMRIWLFLLGYIAILFTSSILFRGVEFRLVRLGLTYTTVLLYILFIVSSHNMLIGLRPNSRVFNLFPLIPILVLLLIINIIGVDFSRLSEQGLEIILLMCVVLIIQCASEELIFRGIIFKYFLINSDRLVHSGLLSSLVFALFHLMSLSNISDMTVIANQLVASFFLGTFLVGLYVLTQNLLVSILGHCIINFPSYANRIAIENDISELSSSMTMSIDWIQLAVASIFYLPYGVIGYLLIIRSRKEYKWT